MKFDEHLDLLDGPLARREFLFEMVKLLMPVADIRYSKTSPVNRLCLINTSNPLTKTRSEHFSAVEILFYEEERNIEKPEAEIVISDAVRGSATSISCENMATGFCQKSSNSKCLHDHT